MARDADADADSNPDIESRSSARRSLAPYYPSETPDIPSSDRRRGAVALLLVFAFFGVLGLVALLVQLV